jgi:hypothetical protein
MKRQEEIAYIPSTELPLRRTIMPLKVFSNQAMGGTLTAWHGKPGPCYRRVKTPRHTVHIYLGPSNYPFLSEPLLKNTATTMVKAEISKAGDTESPVTVPQKLAPQSQSSLLTPQSVRTSASSFPIIQRPQSSPPHAVSERDGSPGPIMDLMAHLHRSAPSVVKTRSGSVLSRGFILKTDHYPSGKPPNHPFALFTDTHTA